MPARHDDITVAPDLATALILAALPAAQHLVAHQQNVFKLTMHCRINIDVHTVHRQDELLNTSADKDNTMTCWRLKSNECDRTSYEPRVNSTTPEPDCTTS